MPHGAQQELGRGEDEKAAKKEELSLPAEGNAMCMQLRKYPTTQPKRVARQIRRETSREHLSAPGRYP